MVPSSLGDQAEARLTESVSLLSPFPCLHFLLTFLLSPASLPSVSHRNPHSSQPLLLGTQPKTNHQCNQSQHYIHRHQQLFTLLIAESLNVLVKLERSAFKGCYLLTITLSVL